MPFTIITGGSFTSTGANVKIPLPSSADYFKTWNITQYAVASPTVCVGGEWFGSKFGAGASAANSGLRWKKVGSSVIQIDSFSTSTASNGFTYVTAAPIVEPQAPNAITAISQASSAVVTQTNTYNNGDIIRIYGTTGMLQLGGIVAEISSVSGSGYTLIGVNTSAFGSAGTAGFTRRVSTNAAVDPEYMYISAVTQATQAVVTTTVDPTLYYVVGNKIHFSIPSDFGMTQLNQLTGTIVALNASTYAITVDIDTSAFTAFAWPASTASPTAPLFATLAPAGSSTMYNPVTKVQTGYEFNLTPFHTGQFTPYMLVSGGAQSPAGANADIINWSAYKFET